MAMVAADPTRYGTRGTQTRVQTNTFPILHLPAKSFYQYTVTIEPELDNPRRRRDVIDKLQTTVQPDLFTPRGYYDSMALLFISHRLQLTGGNTGQYLVALGGQNPPVPNARGTYTVKLALSAGDTIRPNVLHALLQGAAPTPNTMVAVNLLQMIIRAAPNMKHPNNGKAYFTEVGKEVLPGGFELWRGYFQAIRPVLGRCLVNVDTSVSAVYASGRAVDVAMSVTGKRDIRDLEKLSQDEFYHLERHLHKLHIYIHNSPGLSNSSAQRPVKTIHGLVPRGGLVTFMKDGIEVSVKDHYAQAYNYPLKYPNLPGIRTSGRNAPIQAIIPIELCEIIPGQLYRKKLPDNLTAAMVKFSLLRPKDRMYAITNGIPGRRGESGLTSPILEYAASDYVTDAQMQISTLPLEIDGRVLRTPRMRYREQTVIPRNGMWNVTGQKLRVPGALTGWGILNFDGRLRGDVFQRFTETLIQCCGTLGMDVEPPTYAEPQGNPQAPSQALDRMKRKISERMQGKQPRMLIVILPQSAKEIKYDVKRWGDVSEGIPTQCVRADKLPRANDQYCNNVALKLNARLDGTNVTIESDAMSRLTQGPFMVMGADVGHGPSTGPQRPSVATLVWSHDEFATKYVADTRLQEPRTETIVELSDMVMNAVKQFGDKWKKPPARIVFYRDGLSEGEYGTVGLQEIVSIRAAIDHVWKRRKVQATKPLLTFIVVTKRHHIRFCPVSPNDCDRSGNAAAGFVADRGLSHPSVRDFYLQSQGGLQGTSRPAHYIVLLDENYGNNIDELQELSFGLTHVYCKATRSTGIPAPVYYADLACSRAPFYFDDALNFSQENFTGNGQEPDFNLDRWKSAFMPIKRNGYEKTMYFL